MGIFDEYEEYDDPEFKISSEEDEDFDEENSFEKTLIITEFGIKRIKSIPSS